MMLSCLPNIYINDVVKKVNARDTALKPNGSESSEVKFLLFTDDVA